MNKDNTIPSSLKEEEIDKAWDFLKARAEEYKPFTPNGLNQLPYVLYEAVAKAMVQYAQQLQSPGTSDAVEWISVEQDTPNDGEFLGCIEMTEECKAINIRQRVVLNRMNKWVLTEGERLLFWMPLPPLPNIKQKVQ